MVDGNMMAARALAKVGLEHMYGVVGIPVTSLATCAMKAGIRFIAFHNEQAAGYAAGAAGYLTGKPGVFLTVSGPGCVHGLAGLSNAMINTWPVIMISGSSVQADIGRGDFQELDQIEAVKPFVKYAAKAKTVKDIPSIVAKAVAAAVGGRPGGAYIDLPSDVLHEVISEEEAKKLLESLETFVPTWAQQSHKVQELAAPLRDIEKAVSLLRTAQRPLLVFGKGAAYARAEGPLNDFIKVTRIPFLPTPMGKGLISDAHPLCAAAARSLAIGQCDVALVVGARLNWVLHFGEPPRWSKDVKFILIDVCKEEIEIRKPELGLVGDARIILQQINAEIKDNPFALGDKHPWLEAIRDKASKNVERVQESLKKDVVPFNFLTPLRIIKDALAEVVSPSPILVSEGANTMDVGRSVLPQTEPRTRLDAGTWGTMGVGLGYAIAAASVCPETLVVAVEGDSAFGFSGLEVETIVRYGFPIIVIVFNNGGVYGGDRRNPEDIEGPHKADPAPTSFVPDAKYHALMEAFGGKGYCATTPQELQDAVKESFAARKPALINVILDPFAGSESGRMHHRN
ncbi:hypothetical protein GOP47_0007703 [Adiantum capillus-veneris]|uniref:2-hydroxyacyl-CoA lyase n=1 Tax=Adiantum capillus-veneris TaxID=13818 RepID=A0A9D4V1C2_ADICA|nr:hypothetical protein GOP47_0007703 [Adiantum capillus-veneris]